MSRRRQPRNQVTFRVVQPGEDVPPTTQRDGYVLRFASAKLHPLIEGALVATYRT